MVYIIGAFFIFVQASFKPKPLQSFAMKHIAKITATTAALLTVLTTLQNCNSKGYTGGVESIYASTGNNGRYNYAIIKPFPEFKPSTKVLNEMIKALQGSPYVWAEEGPQCFDCSGYTYYLYGKMGIEIPRVSWQQAKSGKDISCSELRFGDLLFFATKKRQPWRISHVGIYIGGGWFSHASTTEKKVVYTNIFRSPFYQKTLRKCKRYLPDEAYDHSLAQVALTQMHEGR